MAVIPTTKVMYDSKRLIPAPLVTIEKNYVRGGDGQKIGVAFNITLTGTIMAWKGSPSIDKSFWDQAEFPPDDDPAFTAIDSRLGNIIRKQEAIRELFATDGLLFEIQSADGTQPLKFNPRILSINFPEGQWVETCPYTINMECDVIYRGGEIAVDGVFGEDLFQYQISTATETWSFDTNEGAGGNLGTPTVFALTHNVSAQGKRFYLDDGSLSLDAWRQASGWVNPRLGYDNSLLSSFTSVPGLEEYNYSRNTQIDEINGNYSVTETWIINSGNYYENFEISSTTSLNDYDAVSINGTVIGLEKRNANNEIVTYAYDNADVAWSGISSLLYNRCKSYSHINTLNAVPQATTLGRNISNGSITYSYNYNSRPSNFITGTISEAISVSDSFDVDVFAAIAVLDRAAGPVLQSIGTHRELVRTVNIELVFDESIAGTGTYTERMHTNNPRFRSPQSTEISDIINGLKPTELNMVNNAGVEATTLYIADQNVSWDGRRYSHTIQYVWE